MRIYAVAIGLMWVGGFVDALGFLRLQRVFLGNMSGDTVRVGLAIATRNWPELIVRATPILSFGAGLILGGVIQDMGRRRAVRRLLAPALIVEAICLAALWAVAPSAQSLRVFVGGVAMGIQNTLLRNSGVLSLYTTHVTGLLTELTEHLSAFLVGVVGSARRRRADVGPSAPRLPRPRREAAAAWRLAVLYAVWIIGAITCSSTMSWGPTAIVLPLSIVVLAAIVDGLSPLAAQPRVRI